MHARFLPLVLTAFVAACAPVDRELTGAWRLSRSVIEGVERKAAAADQSSRTFDKGLFENRHGTAIASHGSFSVDVSATPRRIDFGYEDDIRKGEVFCGIYEVSGNQLRIAVARAGVTRPSDFNSPTGSDIVVDYYERAR